MSDTSYDPMTGIPLTMPDAPGDFSETVTRKEPIQLDENGNPLTAQAAQPFTPLTPNQALEERARLNMKASYRGTLAGSSQVAAAKTAVGLPTPGPEVPQEVIDAAGGFPFVHEGKTYIPEQAKKESQDYLENVQADIVAYKALRPYSGFTEGFSAAAGSTAGVMGSPENVILPQLKIGSAAWYAKNPVMGSILAQGFGQAAIQGGADILSQTNEVRAALKKEYEPAETISSIFVGGALGAGIPAAFHAGSRLFKSGIESIGSRLRGEAPAPAPEFRPPVPPDPPTIKPDPGFEQGGSAQAVVDKQGVPTGETRPEPPVNDGYTRLYHADQPGAAEKDTTTFKIRPEEGTNSFIDLPETVVEPLRNGEDVTLPQPLAEQRQPLPSISAPETVAERVAAQEEAVAARAQAGEKITMEPPPEAGKTFTEFVREQGGLKPSPEVDALYGKKRPDLIRKDGLSLDQMRERAVESKYLRDQGVESGGTATTTPNDVLTMLGNEDKGIKHFPEGQGPKKRPIDQHMEAIEGDVYAEMQSMGHDPTAKENRPVFRDAANRVYRDGLSVENALENALKDAGDRQRAAKFQPEADIPFRKKELVGTSMAPAPGTHRPAGGVPGAPDAPGAAQAANLHGAMRSIARALDVEIRQGVNRPGVVGSLKARIVRLVERGADAYITFAHEMGHLTEQRVGTPLTGMIAKSSESMRAFAGPEATGTAQQIATEGFDEFVALYMSDRDLAKLLDPNFTRNFRDLMEARAPDILEQMDRGHLAYRAYETAPSSRVVTSMITSHPAIAAFKGEDPLKRNAFGQWFDRFYTYMVNEADPFNQMVKKLLRDYEKRSRTPENPAGKKFDLTPDKDPRSVLQTLRNGSHTMTLQEMNGGLLDNANRSSGPGIVSTVQRITADPITGAPAPDLATVAVRKRDFSAYTVAVYHQDLIAARNKGLIDIRRPPTGMTEGDAAQTIAEMEKKYPQFPVLAEEVYAYRKGLAKKELDGGTRDINSWQEINQDWNRRSVPFMRDLSSLTEGASPGGGGGGKRGLEDLGRYRRTGSDADIIDVIDSLMNEHFKINEQVAFNKVMNTTRDFVRNVGGAEAGRFVEEVPNHEMRVNDIEVRRVIEQGLKDQGFLPADARDMARFYMAELNINEKVKLFHAEAIKGGGKPILFGMEGGERYALRFPDTEFGRQVMNAMDFLGPMGTQSVSQAAGALSSILIKPARVLRTGAVTTFTFAVKNMIRDALQSFTTIAGVKFPLQTTLVGLKEMAAHELSARGYRALEPIIGTGESVTKYRATGGLEGGAASAAFSREARTDVGRQALFGGHRFDVAAEERALARKAKGIEVSGAQLALEGLADARKLATEMLRVGTKLGEVSESANRMGIFKVVYERNKAMGRGEDFAMIDAAQKARDFTDFGRHGSGTELLTQTVPFLGASIQGTDKFMRQIGRLTGLDRALTPFEEAEVRDLRKQVMWGLSSMAAVSVFFEYLYQDDGWYQSIPLQQRATNWNFKVMGTPVRIPKPFEWATLLNLAENAMRYVNTGDDQHMYNWMKSIGYTHNVPANFPIISTAIGLASNYDTYFDRPIVSARNQALMPHMQRLNDTSQFYISMAAMLNERVWNSQDAHEKLKGLPLIGGLLASAWSPVEASWMVSRMLGDWPRELGGIDGMTKSLTTGDNLKMADIPVLRSMIQEKLSMGEPIRQIINQTNQHDGALQRAANSYKFYLQANDAVGAQHLFDNMTNAQKEFVRLHQVDAGPVVNNMHPMERGRAIYTAIATILSQMDAPTGIRAITDPTKQIVIDDKMKLPVSNLLTEFAANQARNTLIAQQVPGYKGQAMVPTQPDLDKLKAIAPEIHKELTTQLAIAHVLPWPAVDKYWPQVQTLLAGGGDRRALSIQAKALGMQAAAQYGLEGGGIALSRGKAVIEGDIVKRGAFKPAEVPALP